MHQKLTLPPVVRATRPVTIGVIVLVTAALLLGGATREGFMAQAALRIMALVLLLLTAWRAPRLWTQQTAWPLLILAGLFAIPLLQLVPLPPAVWASLPGRETFAAAYPAAGMPKPWLPLSLGPDATWNAALSLLPPAAVFLAALGMDFEQRRAILPWVLAVAGASVLVGMAQLAEGPTSAARFYEVTNVSAAVGFFANRNHQASLLAAAVPLAAFWALTRRRSGGRGALMVVGVGLTVIFATGVGVSESRAGVLLLAVAGLGCLAMAMRSTRFRLSRRTMLITAGLVVLGLVPALAFGMLDILRDLPQAAQDDPRAAALPTIWRAVLANLPFGTGLGTFDPIYRMLEQPETLTNAFLNHAHNDYVEVFLETGLFGPALIVTFLAWYGRASLTAWRAPAESRTASLARAASLSILLLLLHSAVDYPLRTPALATLFGFLCACLAAPGGRASARPANAGTP